MLSRTLRYIILMMTLLLLPKDGRLEHVHVACTIREVSR